MNDFVLNNEGLIRLFLFLSALIIMAIWEILFPRRPLKTSKAMRWSSNLGLVLIDTLARLIILPFLRKP